MDKAFKSRVRTCVVVKLIHKDVLAFLDDARVLFIVEVPKILREQNALKINAVLNTYYLKIVMEIPEDKNFK